MARRSRPSNLFHSYIYIVYIYVCTNYTVINRKAPPEARCRASATWRTTLLRGSDCGSVDGWWKLIHRVPCHYSSASDAHLVPAWTLLATGRKHFISRARVGNVEIYIPTNVLRGNAYFLLRQNVPSCVGSPLNARAFYFVTVQTDLAWAFGFLLTIPSPRVRCNLRMNVCTYTLRNENLWVNKSKYYFYIVSFWSNFFLFHYCYFLINCNMR